MKKRYWTMAMAGLVTFGLLTTGCSSDETDDAEAVEVNASDDQQNGDSSKVEQPAQFEVPGLPTPNDFFDIIKRYGGDVQVELMNDPGNASKYDTRKTRALNFGVYSADLAYMSTHDITVESAKYLKALETLANDLGISAIFDETIINRIRNSESNQDSLYAVSRDTYIEAYDYLIRNQSKDVLAYMLAGGWVESMHIVSNLVDEFDPENKMIDKIADQKVILESLVDYMVEVSEEYDQLIPVIDDLMTIKEIYDQAELEGGGAATAESQGGNKFTLSGGSELKLNAETYGMIVERVKEIRSSYVGVN